MNVLIVEDREMISTPIKKYFAMKNINCVIKSDGIEGRDEAMQNIYDVIVLDIMLPHMDGVEILRSLRANKIDTPVIFLTAKSTLKDKLIGLESGADDYLTKPFEMEELVARVFALSRRKKMNIVVTSEFGDLTLERETRSLVNKNTKREINVSKIEYLILETLFNKKETIVDKDYLIDKAWAGKNTGDLNSIEVYISFIRKKIDEISKEVMIVSVRGKGYKLCKRATE